MKGIKDHIITIMVFLIALPVGGFIFAYNWGSKVNTIMEQNNQILHQMAYLQNKDIMVWNDKKNQVETLEGKAWRYWHMVVHDEFLHDLCEDEKEARSK